jgi:hypothetical protein
MAIVSLFKEKRDGVDCIPSISAEVGKMLSGSLKQKP